MNVIQYNSYEEMYRQVASKIIEIIGNRRNVATAWPTGSTPLGVYKELIAAHTQSGLDFSGVQSFNMDEYVGLAEDNPNSFYHFLDEHLYRHVNMAPQNIKWFFEEKQDPVKAAAWYSDRIDKVGGFDFLLLGIGSDGHIAFNMPGETFSVHCDVVELSEQTIRDNARFFEAPHEVPKKAVTIGMREILQAKQVILMASGQEKRDVIKRLLCLRRVDPILPASILLLHSNCLLATDTE